MFNVLQKRKIKTKIHDRNRKLAEQKTKQNKHLKESKTKLLVTKILDKIAAHQHVNRLSSGEEII